MHVDRAVVVPIEGEQVGQLVAVEVSADDLRARQVVRPLGRLPDTGPSVQRLQAARRRDEDVHADLEVRVLVDRGDLVRSVRPAEVPDDEARPRGVVLPRTGVVDALVPAVKERRAGRLEVVDAHVEVVVLVDEEEPVVTGAGEVAREDGLGPAPCVAVAPPPALCPREAEARAGRGPDEDAHRGSAVVIERDEIGLAVEVHVRRGDLHPPEVERVRGALVPDRRRELVGRAGTIEHRDPEPQVVARVVERGDLRGPRALEIARNDEAVREGLGIRDAAARADRRDEPDDAGDEGQKKGQQALRHWTVTLPDARTVSTQPCEGRT